MSDQTVFSVPPPSEQEDVQLSSNDGTDAANTNELSLDEPVQLDPSLQLSDEDDLDDGGSDSDEPGPDSAADTCPSFSAGPVPLMAAAAPKVEKKGKNYVWTYTATTSIGPFGVLRDTWGKDNRDWVKDPTNDKKTVLRVSYPKGTSTPSSTWNPKGVKGGTGFYAAPISPSIMEKADFATFQYEVYFPKQFSFRRGGKLPGLWGGSGTKLGCSGGNSATDCFSARFMWRAKGLGEAYLYIPKNNEQDKGLCKVPPKSHLDEKYGSSIGRGAFQFKAGGWTRIKQLVKVNDPEKNNGILKVWANDKLVISFGKMVWRRKSSVKLQGIAFETFFGGSSKDCVCEKEEHVMFRNYQLTAAY